MLDQKTPERTGDGALDKALVQLEVGRTFPPFGLPTDAITKNYQADWYDMVKLDAGDNDLTVTLPTADKQRVGGFVMIKTITAGSGTVTVFPQKSSNKIDGDTQFEMDSLGNAAAFVHDADGNWWVFVFPATSRLTDDLRFPASGINPPGAVSDPGRSTITGLLQFDPSSTEIIAGVAQMPHGWLEGSDIRPHIHIRGITTDPGAGPNNVVQWKLDYKWYNYDDPLPAAYTSETLNFTLPADDTTKVNTIQKFTAISGAGMRHSSLFEWRLSRIGGDAADTYPDDCVLVEFDIHYYSSKLGNSASL